MNFCLSTFYSFFTEPQTAAFYALSGLLIAYGGAVIAVILALPVRAARSKNSAAADTEDRRGAAGVGAPGVSVVIPFRNEEQNLSALLASIDGQNYGGMIEAVLVNDGSTDNGVDVIKKFIPRNENLSINIVDLRPLTYTGTDTDTGTGTRLTSKQQALDLGVERASYQLILFTDADMILAPAWAESMVNSRLSTGADMVFGHTAITETRGVYGLINKLFTLMESYQLEYLFAFAHAFSKLNLMGSCMGNNILVTKEAYAACGGQRGVGYTIVEDRALLGLVRKKGFKTAAQEPFTATAWTYPSQSKRQFANQVLRWAKGGLRPGGGLFAAGLLLLTQNILFLLSIIWTPPPALALQSAANFILTWAFLAISFHKNGSPAPKILFPAYYIFMMAETAAFLPFLLFSRRVEWKNRKV